MQAVILCAGKSTRTYPLTLSRPKPLLPLVNKSILEWNLAELEGVVEEAVLIVGYKAEMVKEAIGDRFGSIRIVYTEQQQQLGTGHAVLQAADRLRGPFLVLNGDDVYSRDDFLRLSGAQAAALVCEVANPSLYGVYQVDADGRVLDLEEKPAKPKGNLANLGCYKFPLEVLQYLRNTPRSERGEIEITSAIRALAMDRPFYAVRRSGRWLPTGFAWDLLKNARSLWIEGAVPARSVHSSSRIHPAATVLEPVHIGPRCEVAAEAVIGPYTVLVADCKVDPAAVVSGSVVMQGSVIGTAAVITDSIVGRGCQLGSCTRTLAKPGDADVVTSEVKGKRLSTGLEQLGAVLGDDVEVGSGVTFLPGVKVWPGIRIPAGQTVQADLRPADFVWE